MLFRSGSGIDLESLEYYNTGPSSRSKVQALIENVLVPWIWNLDLCYSIPETLDQCHYHYLICNVVAAYLSAFLSTPNLRKIIVIIRLLSTASQENFRSYLCFL